VAVLGDGGDDLAKLRVQGRLAAGEGNHPHRPHSLELGEEPADQLEVEEAGALGEGAEAVHAAEVTAVGQLQADPEPRTPA
jgi:hypothetical protein